MKYSYMCPKCRKGKECEMSVAEYDQFEAVCESCGEMMTRVYSAPSVKSSAHGDVGGGSEGQGGCSSCSGGCSGCSSCGM